jgi:XapX domain-containing protein
LHSDLRLPGGIEVKVLFLSFGVGLGVGVLYGFIRVKSPAPPIVALVGLLGMVLGEQFGIWIHTKKLDVSHAASVCLVGERYDRQLYKAPSRKARYSSSSVVAEETNKHSNSLPSATKGFAIKMPTQTSDAKSGMSPDFDEGSSGLSRRNMILGGAAVVAAISLPKNSLASTPLSTTDQPSKNNDGKDDNMNSTTDMAESAHTFNPGDFTVVPARTFEDLRVGEIFRAPSRTLTDAHASAFQAVSADNHPIHYDLEYARRHGHIAPVVHGLQVLAVTAPGATLFPQYIGDVFIAFTEASCKFLKEVHAGDTLYSALEIVALTPQGDSGQVTTRATVHNQRGELVLSGEHKYLLRRRT